MKDGLKKVFVNICILLSLLFLFDAIVGWAGNKYARWLNAVPRDGDAALVNYDLNAATPDVAIIGSSTAICHYVPNIIKDSILVFSRKDCQVFNMGMSKQKMAYNYYALKCLLDRKIPDIVIEDVWASNVSGGSLPKYYEGFRPYVNTNHHVKEMLEWHDSYSILMKSQMYCFNTELVKMLMSVTKPKGADGFRPSTHEMDEIVKSDDKDTADVSPLSVKEFDSMINLCKKNQVKLFVVLSPALHASDTTSASYIYMRDKCSENEVPFLDYSNDKRFLKPHYFSDPLHMNSYGAESFTAELMKDIKPYLSENN